jgi:hypothetical protein
MLKQKDTDVKAKRHRRQSKKIGNPLSISFGELRTDWD